MGVWGPEATSELYSRLLKVCQEEDDATQDSDYPEIFIDSVSFQESDESGILDEGAVLDQFLEALDTLDYAGSDKILIPCNTLHSLIEDLNSEAEAEVVDMVSETISQVEEDDLSRVGLLASETTYEKKIYQKRTEETEILEPEEHYKKELSRIILKIMGRNETSKDREKIAEIADSLEEKGAEAIILGCTELPVLMETGDMNQEIYDTVQILAEEGIENRF